MEYYAADCRGRSVGMQTARCSGGRRQSSCAVLSVSASQIRKRERRHPRSNASSDDQHITGGSGGGGGGGDDAAVDFFSYRHFGFTFCGTISPSLASAPRYHIPSSVRRSRRLRTAAAAARARPLARAATVRPLVRSFSLSSLSLSTWLPPPSRARPD